MKPQQIMIGDWVQCAGCYRRIQSLEFDNTEDEKCWFWSDEDQAWCLLSEHEPVPITPEILEQNGLMDGSETACKKYVFADNLDKCPQTVVEFYFFGGRISADTLLKCWTKPNDCDGQNSSHICNLRYVHQLQHVLKDCDIDKKIILVN